MSTSEDRSRPRALWVLSAVAGLSLALVLGTAGLVGASAAPGVSPGQRAVDPSGEPTTVPSPSEEPTPTPTPTPTPEPEPTLPPVPASAPIRLVHANIQAGLRGPQADKDLAAIYATAPDFITLNEVPGRPDVQLARPGYGIFRTPGQYTGANPVLWNTNRWTALNQGTYNISNVPGRTPSQKVDWGIRYANWVTLQSSAGQVVSVISTHFAPQSKFTMGLTVPSLRRLGGLAATLNKRGPVMIGGDLNVNFHSVKEYPRAEMAALGLTPSFDVLGSAPATGDYKGATIDYVLMRSAPQFVVQNQWTTELLSDHKMLGVDVALLGASASYFVPGVIANDASAPGRVTALTAAVLDKAPQGANVRILTRQLNGGALFRAIRRADKRGVKVAVIVGNSEQTKTDRKLARLLGEKTGKRSYFVQRPQYWKKRKNIPRAVVTASASGGTTALRVDVNRPLLAKSRSKRMVARLRVGKADYDWFFLRFEKLRRR